MDKEVFKQIDEYARKLQEEPNSLVFVPLAELYINNGLIDEALEVCNKGLNVHPELARAKVLLGKITMEKGMNEEAIKILQDVTAKDPANMLAHILLEQVYNRSGKEKEAADERKKIENFQQFGQNHHQMNPDKQEEVLTPTLAELYVKQGLYDDAMRVYRKIIEIDPLNEDARKRLEELKKEKEETKLAYKKRMQDTVTVMKKSVDELQEAVRKLEEELKSS